MRPSSTQILPSVAVALALSGMGCKRHERETPPLIPGQLRPNPQLRGKEFYQDLVCDQYFGIISRAETPQNGYTENQWRQEIAKLNKTLRTTYRSHLQEGADLIGMTAFGQLADDAEDVLSVTNDGAPLWLWIGSITALLSLPGFLSVRTKIVKTEDDVTGEKCVDLFVITSLFSLFGFGGILFAAMYEFKTYSINPPHNSHCMDTWNQTEPLWTKEHPDFPVLQAPDMKVPLSKPRE